MIAARTGYIPTAETCAKIAKALTGKKLPKITKEKISKANTGRKHSEETKQKLRKPKNNTENMKGPFSEEHCKNISLAQKGTKNHNNQCSVLTAY